MQNPPKSHFFVWARALQCSHLRSAGHTKCNCALRAQNIVNSAESVDSCFTVSNETCNDKSNGEVEDYVMIMNPIIMQDY